MSYYGKSFKSPPSRPASLDATTANFAGYAAPRTPQHSRESTAPPQAATMSGNFISVMNLSRKTSKTSEATEATSLNSAQYEEKCESKRERIIGGKYIDEANQDLDADYGSLKLLDIDMPLTLTKIVQHSDKDYVVLSFANGDSQNPLNWSTWSKRSVSTMLNLMTLFIGLATTAYSSGTSSMCADFGVPTIFGQLGFFTFNMACAVTPMIVAPLCELTGRKVVYAGAFLCFSLTFIGLALAKDISTIIGLRLLLGLFGCVGTILVGGTFDDIYEPYNRGRPMAMFSFVAIFGTVAAPIYAGFIDQTIGWRWIEGIQGLANLPLLIAVILFFPETRGGVVLHKRAKKLREATGDDRYVAEDDIYTPDLKSMLRASSVKAVRMLVTEPVVFAFGLWIAFCWGVVFLFLSVIPITFSEKHGWSKSASGLPYISLAIGTLLGWAAHHLQLRKYDRLQADPNVQIVPEHRLYGSMFGSIWLPIGLFIYCFTQYTYLTSVGPLIGLAPIAFGIFFVFESTYSYTADCYGENSSSAIAGQGFMRNTLGAITPLFANAFFHNVGSQYAGLILALLGTFLSMIPFVMFKFGHKLRARSKLAIKYNGN